jgi:hypothetical protein
MNKKYISLGFILLMVLLVFSGCGISQEKYDAVVSDLDAAQAEAASFQSQLDAAQAEAASLQNKLDAAQAEAAGIQSDLDAVQAEVASLQSDLDAAIDEKDGLQIELYSAFDEKDALLEELIAAINDKDTLQNELDTIKLVCPPGEFSSVSELTNWVSINKQPYTNEIEPLFRAALKVQQLGLQEGYLISVIYEKGDQYPNKAWVFNGALVNGSYYVWDPCTGNLYYWFNDIL